MIFEINSSVSNRFERQQALKIPQTHTQRYPAALWSPNTHTHTHTLSNSHTYSVIKDTLSARLIPLRSSEELFSFSYCAKNINAGLWKSNFYSATTCPSMYVCVCAFMLICHLSLTHFLHKSTRKS